MKLRQTLLRKMWTVIILFILSYSVVASMSTAQTSTKVTFNQIANAYENDLFDTFPELGMYWGRNDVAKDRFMDHSLAALNAWQNREDKTLASLQSLNVNDLKGHSEYHTYQLLKQTLESSVATRICKEELWSVNPLWGWQNVLTAVAEKQPVGNAEDRALAIKRWQTVDKIVKDEIDNLKLGLKAGYSAPKPAVERVLKQLHIILNTPIENSPFFDFAKRDGDPQFKKQMANIIREIINPALKHYAHYLETEYLPKARTEVGVAALPNGALCYQAKILKETTLTIKPKAIFDFGQQHMQQLAREVAIIGQKEFGIQDISEVFRQGKSKSQNFFHSEEDILKYNNAALGRAKVKVPTWFDLMPKAPGIIKPYPLYRAQTGAPGEYHPPSDDGQRPGIFYINTHEPQKRSRIDHEATLFHELVPGHHFQIALAIEDKSHHSLDNYLWNSGYGEGWALYVERLADEMGLYQDNISRLGMLSNEALRTCRLVVDPGLHVMGWTRQQAVDYLKHHTALEDNIIESEVDRYIMMPGQATSYMLGKREFDNLRQLAKDTLKTDFDIKEFHNQVLKNGTVTLPMLNQQVQNWLENKTLKS